MKNVVCPLFFPYFSQRRVPSREVEEENRFNVSLNRTRKAIAEILPLINGRNLEPREVIESKSKGVHPRDYRREQVAVLDGRESQTGPAPATR